MPINNNLAYPYVKAIFALAIEKNNLYAWEKLLKLWEIPIKLSPHLFSTSYILSKQKQLELLLNICTVTRIDTFDTASNLLKLLIAKKQLLLLPKISSLYQKLCAKYQQVLVLKIICATELNEGQKQRLKARLEMRFKSQLQLNYEIDSHLIGGIKIYLDDQVIDLSISSQLQHLKEIL